MRYVDRAWYSGWYFTCIVLALLMGILALAGPAGAAPVLNTSSSSVTVVSDEEAAAMNTGDTTSDSGSSVPQQLAPTEKSLRVNVGGDSSVKSVLVTGTGLDDLIVTGLVQSGPGTLAPPKGTLYQYIDLTAYQYDSINHVAITFTVPRSWMVENRVEPGSIRMHRSISGRWTLLPTSILSDYGDEGLFLAKSEGFSLVAITGESVSPVSTEKQLTFGELIRQSETVEPPALKAPPAPDTVSSMADDLESKKILMIPGVIVLVAGLVVLTAGSMMAQRWWGRRKDRELPVKREK